MPAEQREIFLVTGAPVAIDDIVIGEERLAIYRRGLADRPFRLVVLAPPVDVALSRDEYRGYKRVGTRWVHLGAEQREKLGGLGLCLDTGELTASETVDAILAESPAP